MNAADKRTDGELYRSFLGGETTAYDQLMIRYGNSLTAYLYGYLQDLQEAEDLMIEAFARIMSKQPRIADGAFKAYLFRTGRNLALRAVERRRCLQMFSVDGMPQEVADSIIAGSQALQEGSDPTPQRLALAERNRLLRECLERIEPQLREALWLVYVEGMTYAQAAGVMGVRTKRVERLLARGKQQMRTELEKEGVTNAYE